MLILARETETLLCYCVSVASVEPIDKSQSLSCIERVLETGPKHGKKLVALRSFSARYTSSKYFETFDMKVACLPA